ncbi:class II fumarate hydratase [Rheinheimera maricola]|uniref:Fumarate hydratase class II n=1 Tax=Rheinheimera maricola TaxID=2793282 RepID=A0ABS7XAM2_9GAMM|nr:class II fumarate hydratase [Rheinheimera maricola]MBZ9612200.1 class II fumarate hydratase [Rheinheimera maricola]
MKTRTEHDSMGPLQVPATALYQAQTQRAVQNFAIGGLQLPLSFIQALLQIKHAAASANLQLGLLDAKRAEAIMAAAEAQLANTDMQHYPLDVFQTGSATSSNMNVNEVLATLASRQLALDVHPNDHVNLGQSSNDTIPSAIHLSAATAIFQHLLPAVQHLQTAMVSKSQQIGHIVKTGRTHLMDAMPVSFSQILAGWQSQLANAEQQIQQQTTSLLQLAQGGTAVGTGINADPRFASEFCHHLSRITGLRLSPAKNFFSAIGSQDSAVATSGALKTLAVCLMKISNDLRWMNSGPLAGLAEIALPALQPGSSIMPGKVNPVIPEAVAMACAQVIGNDSSITIAGQSGNFELNVMLPLIAYNLLQSISLLSNSCTALAEQAIAGFTVQEDNISKTLALNPILVTALNPLIGYTKAAAIAKQAFSEKRPVLDVALEHTSFSRSELEQLLDPARLCQGGNISSA